MLNPKRKCLVIVISIVVIGWLARPCMAEQEKPTIDQILQAWKNRQEKLKTARFQLSCEETIHKGSISLMVARQRKIAGLPPESEPNPPKDYLVKGTSSISLDGSKLRYSCETEKWDPIDKRLYPEYYVDVFDGKLYKFMTNPSSAQVDYAAASIAKAKKSRSAMQFPLLPLIITLRGNDSHFFQKLSQFQVTGQIVNIGGRSCVELMDGTDQVKNREALYLDRDRDYVLVREVILTGGQPSWQLDVTYSPDSVIGWVPQSWEYIIRAGMGHQIANSGRKTVTRYEINPPMDEKEFNIVFPAKTMVLDSSSGSEVQYVIQENGERGRVVPASLVPRYEDLAKASRPTQRWLWVIVWGVLFVLMLGGWIWLRLRRLKGTHQQS